MPKLQKSQKSQKSQKGRSGATQPPIKLNSTQVDTSTIPTPSVDLRRQSSETEPRETRFYGNAPVSPVQESSHADTSFKINRVSAPPDIAYESSRMSMYGSPSHRQPKLPQINEMREEPIPSSLIPGFPPYQPTTTRSAVGSQWSPVQSNGFSVTNSTTSSVRASVMSENGAVVPLPVRRPGQRPHSMALPSRTSVTTSQGPRHPGTFERNGQPQAGFNAPRSMVEFPTSKPPQYSTPTPPPSYPPSYPERRSSLLRHEQLDQQKQNHQEETNDLKRQLAEMVSAHQHELECKDRELLQSGRVCADLQKALEDKAKELQQVLEEKDQKLQQALVEKDNELRQLNAKTLQSKDTLRRELDEKDAKLRESAKSTARLQESLDKAAKRVEELEGILRVPTRRPLPSS
ncbi:hypothetical protein BT63DRAFT_102693 [Microthyrium microscopicum]|uniref:Uncharacterized protein n=1 Tax=Microthyrium microscopicum TaxID=703497 RepID=A0A6A6TYV2_9PEZI|nr:hypothetical protein BT63DRAFT_102693 [Microthyrium microscopicum]